MAGLDTFSSPQFKCNEPSYRIDFQAQTVAMFSSNFSSLSNEWESGRVFCE